MGRCSRTPGFYFCLGHRLSPPCLHEGVAGATPARSAECRADGGHNSCPVKADKPGVLPANQAGGSSWDERTATTTYKNKRSRMIVSTDSTRTSGAYHMPYRVLPRDLVNDQL